MNWSWRQKLILTLFIRYFSFSDENEIDKNIGHVCNHRKDCGILPGLACIEGNCSFCTDDSHCNNALHSVRKKCRQSHYSLKIDHTLFHPKICVEKDLFDPFTVNDALTTALVFLCTALCSGAGLGGGGILVPIYMIQMRLDPKYAIPLSKATIFGVSVALFFVNIRKNHPYAKDRRLIDYGLAMLMEPATLGGTVCGVLLNHILPSWIILILLFLLLSFISYRTFLKGLQVHRQEINQNTKLKSFCKKSSLDIKSVALHWLHYTRKRINERKVREQDKFDFLSLPPLPKISNTEFLAEKMRFRIISDESKIFPLKKTLPLVLAWSLILITSLLRGGHGASSIIGISCGSIFYWILVLSTIPIVSLITYYASNVLRLLNRSKVLAEYPFVSGDIHWTRTKTMRYPLVCILAGIAAGTLGVGGGMVKGPVMLEMGVLPQVQSATAAFMILFTSSSTTLQFAIAGQFPGQRQYDYVLWYAFIGFLGGVIGQMFIGWLVKKYNKTSLIIMLLAVILSISTIMMTYIGSVQFLQDLHTHHNLGFSSQETSLILSLFTLLTITCFTLLTILLLTIDRCLLLTVFRCYSTSNCT